MFPMTPDGSDVPPPPIVAPTVASLPVDELKLRLEGLTTELNQVREHVRML